MMINITLDQFKNKYGLVERKGMEHIEEIAYHIIPTLVNYHRYKTFFEIGTCYGDCVTMIAENCPTIEKIWTVGVNCQQFQTVRWNRDDYEVWWEVGREIKKSEIAKDKVIQIVEDSRNLDPEDFPKMDFIFIDGNHNEEFILNDTLKALQMIKKGGIIFWHDWNFDETKNVLNYLSKAIDIINVDRENATFYIHR